MSEFCISRIFVLNSRVYLVESSKNPKPQELSADVDLLNRRHIAGIVPGRLHDAGSTECEVMKTTGEESGTETTFHTGFRSRVLKASNSNKDIVTPLKTYNFQ